MRRVVKILLLVLALTYAALFTAAVSTEPREYAVNLPWYCLRAHDTWGFTYTREQTRDLCPSFACVGSALAAMRPDAPPRPPYSIRCVPPVSEFPFQAFDLGKKWQSANCADYGCTGWGTPPGLYSTPTNRDAK